MAELESELERQFHEAMLSLLYVVGQRAGVLAALLPARSEEIRWCRSNQTSVAQKTYLGLHIVQERNRLDLAVESYVLNPNWQRYSRERNWRSHGSGWKNSRGEGQSNGHGVCRVRSGDRIVCWNCAWSRRRSYARSDDGRVKGEPERGSGTVLGRGSRGPFRSAELRRGTTN